MATVIGVVGGSGGVGASSFAAALAWVAGAVLLDVDEAAGGIDVLLGIEAEPGARWSALRLAGGALEPSLLLDGLPRWGPVPVLAADAPVSPHAGQVLAAAGRAGPVVLDLPRAGSAVRDQLAGACSLLVAVIRREVAALVAAQTVLRHLAASAPVPCGLVLAAGPVPVSQVGRYVDGAVLGLLPRQMRLSARGPSRRTARLAAGIITGALPGYAGAASFGLDGPGLGSSEPQEAGVWAP